MGWVPGEAVCCSAALSPAGWEGSVCSALSVLGGSGATEALQVPRVQHLAGVKIGLLFEDFRAGTWQNRSS